MAYMNTLPVLPGTKFIVIEEESDVIYARSLIAGWYYAWKEADSDHSIDLLYFADPGCSYEFESKPLTTPPENIRIHDYYSTDINKAERNDLKNLECILKTIKSKSRNTVVIDCLSSLILYVGLAKALWFVEKLSRQVSQLICIYRSDFVQNKIPSIETLGTTYIKLEKFSENKFVNTTYIAKLIYRKLNGSVICQTELVGQFHESYKIQSKVIMSPKSNKTSKSEPVKIESSFKIEINAREMEQRDKTPLPYTLNTANTSKIFYQPDDVDDIDEDDPDDDLMIL